MTAPADVDSPPPLPPLVVGLFPSFFYSKSSSGEFRGFGIELARSLAARLDCHLVLREFPAPPAVVTALKAGECEVAFLGLDPARAVDVGYSPAYLRADFSFLVPANSKAARIADVDLAGHRVAVVRDHAMDFALKGKLQHAERIYAATPDAAFALFQGGEADALAGIRPGLVRYAEQMNGSRVLEDRYGENVLALAVAKSDAKRLSDVTRFIVEARQTGLLRRIIADTGLAGAEPILA